MKKSVFYFLLFVLGISCNSSEDSLDCSSVLCEALSIDIKLIDEKTGGNYIDENELELSDFVASLENSDTLSNSSFFIYKNEKGESILNMLFVSKASINIEKENKVISLVMIKSDPKTNTCCDFGNIEDVSVTNYKSDYNSQNRSLTINL